MPLLFNKERRSIKSNYNEIEAIFVHEINENIEVEIPSRCFEPFRIGRVMNL